MIRKTFVGILFLLCLFQANCQNEGRQPMSELVAMTVDALVDTMNSFCFVQDTMHYFTFGTGFSNEVMQYSRHRLPAVGTKEKGRVAVYIYTDEWHLDKEYVPTKSLNVFRGPYVTFLHDTVSIRITSTHMQWEKFRGCIGKCWTFAISDWIICKYLYSEEKKRWVMVSSDFGGV